MYLLQSNFKVHPKKRQYRFRGVAGWHYCTMMQADPYTNTQQLQPNPFKNEIPFGRIGPNFEIAKQTKTFLCIYYSIYSRRVGIFGNQEMMALFYFLHFCYTTYELFVVLGVVLTTILDSSSNDEPTIFWIQRLYRVVLFASECGHKFSRRVLDSRKNGSLTTRKF